MAGLAGGVEDAVPRAGQLPQHVDQRYAVQSGRETIEQFGGLGVAQRGQFLNLAQPDGDTPFLGVVTTDIADQPVSVCTICGHTVIGGLPDKCPVCAAAKEYYRTF